MKNRIIALLRVLVLSTIISQPSALLAADDFVTMQGGQLTQSGTGQAAKLETTSTGSGVNKTHKLKTDSAGGGGGGGDASAANQVTGNNTAASILAKIIAAPATEAKQDTANTSLASILAKIIAAPATEAKQDTGNTSLGSIDTKLSSQATAANQATQITAEQAIQDTLGATNGAAVVTNANGTVQQYLRGLVTLWGAGLPSGSNVIGKVGIDQTTPGTTNAVQLTGAQLTIAESVVTAGATIAAGKFHIEFIFSSDFAGTINGVAYTGATDQVKDYDAPPGRTFAAVTYTISAGSARLTTW